MLYHRIQVVAVPDNRVAVSGYMQDVAEVNVTGEIADYSVK